MTSRTATRGAVALCTVVFAALGSLGSSAVAVADPPSIVVSDGVTQPVFGYTDAIRERVFVEADFDADANGINETIIADIIRPAASDLGMQVPVIMDASPYYSTLCRGNESECKQDEAGQLLQKWPLFYDNYFVPRGYAVVLVDMAGTNKSTGCTSHGAIPDKMSAVAIIDWLNGRRVGKDKDDDPMLASWHNGKTAMIGKSYDGTLANAAASTGVVGLTTIVPISAIASWYDYSRNNGIRFNDDYPGDGLHSRITDAADMADCAATRALLNATDGDETGDYTPFWAARDYLPDTGRITASVFAYHGQNDDNVRPDHFSKWWYQLTQRHIPRKLWLSQTGHVDPFDDRRSEWVHTLHRWFDYWLLSVPNGIMTEPMVDIETGPTTWETQPSYPVPGSTPTQLFLSPGPDAGTIRLTPAPGVETTTSFTDANISSEAIAMKDPTTIALNKRVFLTPPLTAPLRISGTTLIQLRASVDKTDTNLAAMLVDYGTATLHVNRASGDGASTSVPVFGPISPPSAFSTASLVVKAAAGETSIRVSGVAGLGTGTPITIDSLEWAESATVASAKGGNATLSSATTVGATALRLDSTANFAAGDTVLINQGADLESRTIATVKPTNAIATTLAATAAIGATNIKVASISGVAVGDTINIDIGADIETRTVAGPVNGSGVFNGTNLSGGTGINLSAPLAIAHSTGANVYSGITFTTPLTPAHASGTIVTGTGLTLTAPLTKNHVLLDCWGLDSATPFVEDACYDRVSERLIATSSPWRVSKGVLDAQNRLDYALQTPLTVGATNTLSWPLLPYDYTFPAGHQIGIIILGQFTGYATHQDGPIAVGNITLSLKRSRVILPVVGGRAALTAAGLPGGTADTTTTVSSAPTPTSYGTATTLSATVAATDPSNRTYPIPAFVQQALPVSEATGLPSLGNPSGTVQFQIDGSNVGSPQTLVGGIASWAPPATLAVGGHTIGAIYSGDANFTVSSDTDTPRSPPTRCHRTKATRARRPSRPR